MVLREREPAELLARPPLALGLPDNLLKLGLVGLPRGDAVLVLLFKFWTMLETAPEPPGARGPLAIRGPRTPAEDARLSPFLAAESSTGDASCP